MKSWRGGVKIQKKVRIAPSEFSHLWADHLAGSSNFSYAQRISTPCLQYIGFIRLGFLKVRVLLKNPFYQTSQCKSLNNKLSGWKLISVYLRQTQNVEVRRQAYFSQPQVPSRPQDILCLRRGGISEATNHMAEGRARAKFVRRIRRCRGECNESLKHFYQPGRSIFGRPQHLLLLTVVVRLICSSWSSRLSLFLMLPSANVIHLSGSASLRSSGPSLGPSVP